MSEPPDPDREPTNVREPDGRVPGRVLAGQEAAGDTDLPAQAPGSPPASAGEAAAGQNGQSGRNGGSGPTVGGAVLEGIKEAGAPVMRLLETLGGHLILVGRASGGASISVAEYGAWAGLSEYEVTCGMSKRVPRTYVGETP